MQLNLKKERKHLALKMLASSMDELVLASERLATSMEKLALVFLEATRLMGPNLNQSNINFLFGGVVFFIFILFCFCFFGATSSACNKSPKKNLFSRVEKIFGIIFGIRKNDL